MAIVYALMFAAGFAVCWFFKDWIVLRVAGAETAIRSFEDKIKAIKAKL